MAEEDRLREISPTLVSAIRRCGLAVYLSRQGRRSSGGFVSNPPARLGSAVHRVLAWVAGNCFDLGPIRVEGVVRERWANEIAVEEQRAVAQPAERYFGPATDWPGYATAMERLVLEAEALAAELVTDRTKERWVEVPLSTTSPPMRGSPDLVLVGEQGATIVEFKSGAVTPQDVTPSGRYGLQVLLYALMAVERGVQVVAGEVRPVGRPKLEVPLSDEAIGEAQGIATAALDGYNGAVRAGETTSLGNPSDTSCFFCPHTLRCPALWDEGGLGHLDEMQVVEGTITKLQSSHIGSVAMELEAVVGTRSDDVIITGLDPSRLIALEEVKVGDRVRVSGVRALRTGGPLGGRSGSWVQLSRKSDA